MKSFIIKIFAIILMIILIANAALLALGKMPVLIFWFIIIMAGISSLVINKYLKVDNESNIQRRNKAAMKDSPNRKK
jgi:hypothetical protein